MTCFIVPTVCWDGVPRFRGGTRVLEFMGNRVPGFWSDGVLGFRSNRALEFEGSRAADFCPESWLSQGARIMLC